MTKPLPTSLSKRINIFLSLDRDIFKSYFNVQDPSPIYKRQLSHQFEKYIMTLYPYGEKKLGYYLQNQLHKRAG